jgi:hypothetical protein
MYQHLYEADREGVPALLLARLMIYFNGISSRFSAQNYRNCKISKIFEVEPKLKTK